MTAALLGTLVLIFAIIKILTILGDEQTIWAWLGLVLAIVIAVGAFQTVQEAGGVDTLRSEASSLGSSGQTAPAATTPAPPPPAAMPETAPPAAADMPSEAAPPPDDATEPSDREA